MNSTERTIRGRVTTPSGQGLRNATVTLIEPNGDDDIEEYRRDSLGTCSEQNRCLIRYCNDDLQSFDSLIEFQVFNHPFYCACQHFALSLKGFCI